MEHVKKKHASIKKGAAFVVIGENTFEEKKAYKNVGVEVTYEKVGQVYFKLGTMFCRAPRSACSGEII